jgi:uncharacterized lipoprotein YehR (DUF1307 family)
MKVDMMVQKLFAVLLMVIMVGCGDDEEESK